MTHTRAAQLREAEECTPLTFYTHALNLQMLKCQGRRRKNTPGCSCWLHSQHPVLHPVQPLPCVWQDALLGSLPSGAEHRWQRSAGSLKQHRLLEQLAQERSGEKRTPETSITKKPESERFSWKVYHTVAYKLLLQSYFISCLVSLVSPLINSKRKKKDEHKGSIIL